MLGHSSQAGRLYESRIVCDEMLEGRDWPL